MTEPFFLATHTGVVVVLLCRLGGWIQLDAHTSNSVSLFVESHAGDYGFI